MRLIAALAVGVAVSALGVWAQNTALVGVNYDDGIYALLGKALADGEGYLLTFLPMTLPGVKYPPVYPLSLAPFWSLAGSQAGALHAMKVANGLYIGLAAGLFTWLVSSLRLLPVSLAAAAAVVGFAAASMMLVTAGLLSEPLYLVLLFAALWTADGMAEDERSWGFVVVGLLAALTMLTRTVGVAAVAAAVIGLWMRVGRRPALLAAGSAGVLIIPWTVYGMVNAGSVPHALVPRFGSYVQLYLANLAGSPSAALDIFWTNFGAILQTLGGKLVPQLGAVPQVLAGAFLVVLAVLGTRKLMRQAPATVIYPWLYLALVSVWSFPPFRFDFIVFPMLLVLAVVSWLAIAKRAANVIGRRGGARWVRASLVAAGLVLVANLAVTETRALSRRVWDGAEVDKSIAGAELVDWVNANTDSSAVIAYEFDPLVALYTGRLTVPNNYEPVHLWYRTREPPVEPLAELLGEAGVDYVAVRGNVPLAASTIDSLLERYPGSLNLRFVTPHGVMIFVAEPAAFLGGGVMAGEDARGGS
jgi:hypothetical protein